MRYIVVVVVVDVVVVYDHKENLTDI